MFSMWFFVKFLRYYFPEDCSPKQVGLSHLVASGSLSRPRVLHTTLFARISEYKDYFSAAGTIILTEDGIQSIYERQLAVLCRFR